MADKPPLPPLPGKPPRRAQTQTERDIASEARRRERLTQPGGVPIVPTEFLEPTGGTGVHEGEALDRIRAKRLEDNQTNELLHLARRVDKLDKEWSVAHGETKGALGAIVGELKGLTTVVMDVLDARKAKRDRNNRILAGLFSGGALVEILHRLGVM